jgi:hypothetical protein
VSIGRGDLNLTALRIYHPEFPGAVIETEFFLIVDLGGGVGRGKDFDHNLGSAPDIVIRIGLLESAPAEICHVSNPQFIFGERPESDLDIYIAARFGNRFEQSAKIPLNQRVFQLRSGHWNDLTVAELVVDRAGVFGELSKLRDSHQVAGDRRHNG